ncbi:MAG: S-methyl-5-thioribose-1-phosphate isomerase [Candidatus Omnitrophica bacterium]|nr:S-methyl-5-thioribose-1-phosphate isomerase [Candidatus Omnitrophota bacterium]
MRAIKFKNKQLFYIDQTKLPLKEVWKECKGLDSGYKAIKELQVRGAPLIGVFAAYCVYIHFKNKSLAINKFLSEFRRTTKRLKSCRPTAVNLAWALEKVEQVVLSNNNKGKSGEQLKEIILKEAKTINQEDVKLCENMAKYGVRLIKKGDNILTHCNAGFLATSGDGTAISVIYKAYERYKDIRVYSDETRPLLQGSRLSAWELTKRGVPTTVICDSMAATLMEQGKIDKIIVGADRIAANGDAANKIGTYGLAILANYYKIPFYIVAPFSTFDLSLKSGKFIPIEERKKDEVRKLVNRIEVAPRGVKVYNPAFDVTPNKLITAIISDKGVINPPFKKSIKKILK